MYRSTKCRTTLRVNCDASGSLPGGVSASRIPPELMTLLANCANRGDTLTSVLRVTVDHHQPSPASDSTLDVSGRCFLKESELCFQPSFPLERDLKYRATFDLAPLGLDCWGKPLEVVFTIPSEKKPSPRAEVKHIYPSSDVLPENLLRLYVSFSKSMQQGRALEEICLLDSTEHPVADALYRAPVELWDPSMTHLTVLLDPGRLKRWVGPNLHLGPPLRPGHKYTLQIGSGMKDMDGNCIVAPHRKDFVVGEPVREALSTKDWVIGRPRSGTREPVIVTFSAPLDWALLFSMITIRSATGTIINGVVSVDECERRWRFTPTSPWRDCPHIVSVRPELEDICGNSFRGAFDKPLRPLAAPMQLEPRLSVAFEPA